VARARRPKVTLHSFEGIPSFANEAEEAAFWDSHELGEEIVARMEPVPEGVLPPARPGTTSVAIRFDTHTLGRVKDLARRRRTGYQTLIKEFVTERTYEEEKRERPAAIGKE